MLPQCPHADLDLISRTRPDILVVPDALGPDVRFVEGEGPRLEPVLARIADHPARRIAELLPRNRKAIQLQAEAA